MSISMLSTSSGFFGQMVRSIIGSGIKRECVTMTSLQNMIPISPRYLVQNMYQWQIQEWQIQDNGILEANKVNKLARKKKRKRAGERVSLRYR